MLLNVRQFSSATTFLQRCEPFLARNEVANELILSIALQQIDGVISAKTTRFYAVVDHDEPILAVMYTPDVWPTMTDGPRNAGTELARYLFSLDSDVTRAHGPTIAVRGFVAEWMELSGRDAEVQTRQRIYSCTGINKVTLPEGSARKASVDDIDLIVRWNREFYDELHIPNRSDETLLRDRVEQGRYFLWISDEPVSLAAYGRGTPHGASVGPVYTPSAFRGRGYATACTAVVTRAILDDGKRYASLYTDLDNPTSNSIYQKIGYKPVCDVDLWRFI